MTEAWCEAAPAPRAEWRDGWRVLLASVLGMGSGISMFVGVIGFFMKPLQAEFGWGRGELALVAFAPLLTSMMLPLFGILVDRYGVARFVALGTMLFALSYVVLSAMPDALWIYLGLIAFIGLIAGPLSSPLVFTRPLIVSFERWRGTAVSIGMSGGYVLSVVVFPILAATIAAWGWRAGFLLLAPLTLVTGGVAAFLLRDDGRPATTGAMEAAEGATLHEAIRSRPFWLLLAAIILGTVSAGGIVGHLQPLLSDKGVGAAEVGLYASFFSASVIGGRLATGVLLDRLWPGLVGCASLILPVAGLLILAMPASSAPVLIGSMALLGFGQGAEGNLIGYFTARLFGHRAFGVIYGVLGFGYGVAFSIGGVAFGYSFDLINSYSAALLVSGAMSVAGAFAMLGTGRHGDALPARRSDDRIAHSVHRC
ncbi:MFS transporter [Sphingomonas sp. CL5.1]|uniref:MFS transporter n=1 Tax=Sphingomonas sp. CL5.1 TaxID=2653203 RepID=UPI001582AC0B|nr:MFS transporter [Sphingomonas sp. CL5.1]QKS01121.1 MFS transporter [Sphingomonas sp. CL5.1]